ncbi:MAG: DNA replication/repair protein RecF [Geodermatophilaceae bacterium]|nr:DNA replication/repair protein RecF [Geodermatophilaceae bacterium]
MYVRQLSVTDWRNWSAAELPLDPGPAVLVGRNGTGKTNLLEAIAYAATLGSHRAATDVPLVRSGQPRAVVRTAVVRDGRELRIEIELTPGKANRARVNRAPVPRARDVLGILRTVLFAPEDLALVKGDPGERRRFLDELMVLRNPRYAAVRADYERVLRQRNALLKTAGVARRAGSAGDLRTLDVWDGHLAEHGGALLTGRLDLLSALRPFVVTAYDRVSDGGAPAQLTYESSLAAAVEPGDRDALGDALRAALEAGRAQEVERGVTLSGPHRDDVTLGLGALPARGYASHGESWSLALALKLASYELLRSDGGEPVLLLDDVFAELDTARRTRLAEIAAGAEQAVITAAVAADVPESLQGARYDVADGSVRRTG